MKTLTILYPGIKKVLVSALILTSLTVNAADRSTAEKSPIRLNSISGMTSLSGIGFGLRYSPMVGISLSDRLTLSAGPVLRADKPHFAGYLVKGRYMLMNCRESFSGGAVLYAFGSYERNINQYFSNSWNEIEVLTSRNVYGKEFDFRDIRFNGYEITSGFGVGHYLTNRFSLNMEFGLSIHKIYRQNYETIKLYHRAEGFTMHMSLTARFDLHKN